MPWPDGLCRLRHPVSGSSLLFRLGRQRIGRCRPGQRVLRTWSVSLWRHWRRLVGLSCGFPSTPVCSNPVFSRGCIHESDRQRMSGGIDGERPLLPSGHQQGGMQGQRNADAENQAQTVRRRQAAEPRCLCGLRRKCHHSGQLANHKAKLTVKQGLEQIKRLTELMFFFNTNRILCLTQRV